LKARRTQPILCRSCKGRGGFEGARNALTLGLREATLALKPRRVSTIFVSVLAYSVV